MRTCAIVSSNGGAVLPNSDSVVRLDQLIPAITFTRREPRGRRLAAGKRWLCSVCYLWSAGDYSFHRCPVGGHHFASFQMAPHSLDSFPPTTLPTATTSDQTVSTAIPSRLPQLVFLGKSAERAVSQLGPWYPLLRGIPLAPQNYPIYYPPRGPANLGQQEYPATNSVAARDHCSFGHGLSIATELLPPTPNGLPRRIV